MCSQDLRRLALAYDLLPRAVADKTGKKAETAEEETALAAPAVPKSRLAQPVA